MNISPDGTQAAIDIPEPGNRDVYIVDLGSEDIRRLTFDPAQDSYPVWTADSKRVIFRSAREGQDNIFWKAADGTGPITPLTTSDNYQTPQSVYGSRLLFSERSITGTQPETHHVLSLEGEHTISLLFTGGSNERGPDVSPDGRWVAYSSDETGRNELRGGPHPLDRCSSQLRWNPGS